MILPFTLITKYNSYWIIGGCLSFQNLIGKSSRMDYDQLGYIILRGPIITLILVIISTPKL